MTLISPPASPPIQRDAGPASATTLIDLSATQTDSNDGIRAAFPSFTCPPAAFDPSRPDRRKKKQETLASWIVHARGFDRLLFSFSVTRDRLTI
jgi:hypothetical protein